MTGLFDTRENTSVISRITILETLFKQFMNREDKSLKEVKDTLSEIMTHLESFKRDNQISHDKLKNELLETVDKQYATKTAVSESITGIRHALLQDMKKEQKSIIIYLGMAFAGFSTAAMVFAWIYVNLLQGVS